MRLSDHFNAFMRPTIARNYPVIAINYHKLWDNLPAVMEVTRPEQTPLLLINWSVGRLVG